MIDKGSPLVREGWTGPGRCDIKITPRKPEEDGLHIDMFKKGMYEQNRTFRKMRPVV